MAYSIRNKKKGKYTEKIDSSYLDQVYLETIDSQVLFEDPVVINGITYDSASGTDTATHKYNQTLANILAILNSSGGLYRLAAGTTANIVKIQKSTDGGTTWSDVNSVTVNNVVNATNATNVNLTATGTNTSSITIKAGSGTAASFTVDYVRHAAEATSDASGNTITATYATKTELQEAVDGKTAGYVTSASLLNGTDFEDLVVDKSASQVLVSITASKTTVFPNITVAGLTVEDIKVGDTIYLTDSDKFDWFVGEKVSSGTDSYVIKFYSIEADLPVLTNYVSTTDILTSNKLILGNGNKTVKTSTYGISTTAITSSGAGNDTDILTSKAVVGTITNKVANLDVSDLVATPTSGTAGGPSRTLATLSEVDGKIQATFQDISITKSQISDFPTFTLNGSSVANPSWYASTTAPSTGQVFTNLASTYGNSYIYSGLKADGTTFIQSVYGSSSHGLDLGDSGIGAGTYSAIQVNAKGIAIAGGQMVVFATGLSDSKLNNLAEGGIGIIYE